MGKSEEGDSKGKEGHNLMGKPTFKKLNNGRFKCVETGHEVPANARDSYAQSKHCRLGLIDSALSRKKPPLNTFHQDPACRSKLICKLTGATVNKTEEHIWKHINGKWFLSELEKKESENLTPGEGVEKQSEQTEPKIPKLRAKDLKKKKRKQEENSGKPTIEVGKVSKKGGDSVVEFWMPSDGDRLDIDNDNGLDRWDSGSESGLDTEDAEVAEAATEGDHNEGGRISKRAKRKAIKIGPGNVASSKKKKKKTK